MTDRELLAMAAKAAGIEGGFLRGQENFYASELQRADGMFWWNPLTDDGDALRLAVKLRLLVLPSEGGQTVTVDSFTAIDEATENAAHDPYAATRRAIVRAAAAIGGASQ